MKKQTRQILIWSTLLAMLATAAHAAPLDVSKGGEIHLIPGQVYDGITGLQGPYFALPAGTSIIGRTDQSQPFPILRVPSSSEGYAFKMTSNGCRMTGVRLEGGGLFVEGPNAVNTAPVVVGNQFATVITGNGLKRNALEFSCYVVNGQITDNVFSGNAGFAIMNDGHGSEGTQIVANVWTNMQAGLHWVGGGDKDYVAQNRGSGIIGQSVEIQGSFTNLVVEDNDYDSPNTTIANGSKYAYSLPNDKGAGMIVRRNRAVIPKGSTLIVFELGGSNLNCYDNYGDGGIDMIAVNGMNATGIVHDNLIRNYSGGVFNNDRNNAHTTMSNNSPNVTPTWDIRRPAPQPFSRYGQSPPATQPIPPVVIPPTTIPVPVPIFTWPDTIQMTAPGTQPANYKRQ